MDTHHNKRNADPVTLVLRPVAQPKYNALPLMISFTVTIPLLASTAVPMEPGVCLHVFMDATSANII